ncbi:unnamed protein product [Didymodactylos carnosus]|uniref:Uncharacterized protein n=1 Tax=Didymodactylos carnosus TaxID=1234261 RepID=A0A815Y7T6_9BILA|nr:unnamed protein product [Didymodactylos carnosus]CAF1567238.1 unnamed protein product [Didymodactylos carnosus]CAF3919030.1 unnamed protein product [Didymodactylos carnosus]CAF4429666.1 unnamed protein product [Didymodactylos carnosus]
MSTKTHSSSKKYNPPTPVRRVNRLPMHDRTNCQVTLKNIIPSVHDRLHVLIEKIKDSKNSSIQLLLQLYNRKRSLMEIARRNEPTNQLYHCVQMELFQQQIFDSLSKIVPDMISEEQSYKNLQLSNCLINGNTVVYPQKLSPIRTRSAKIVSLKKS